MPISALLIGHHDPQAAAEQHLVGGDRWTRIGSDDERFGEPIMEASPEHDVPELIQPGDPA